MQKMSLILPRRCRVHLCYRVIIGILALTILYNISTIIHHSIDNSHIDNIDEILAKSHKSHYDTSQSTNEATKFDNLLLNQHRQHLSRHALRAADLRVVSGQIHQHLLKTINNSLFLRQGKFILPSIFESNQKIFGKMSLDIFPQPINVTDRHDRIWNQMRYIPTHVANKKLPPKAKVILLYNGMAGVSYKDLQFCPVQQCRLTADREVARYAHVILFMHNIIKPFHKRPPNQVWAFYFLESPLHTPQFSNFETAPEFGVNWTATYRHDSTIVAPYFKYTPYNLTIPVPEKYPLPQRNYAQNKSKMVAWFVSNCASSNNRMKFATKLGKFIKVDIYGNCGSMTCPRHQATTCFQMLNKDYRFYLAFENSNCREYITEKFFLNGLSNDVIPIVMGAHPDDYKRASPPQSFIHVDHYPSVESLAKYLNYLSHNETAFNEYFAWKSHGMVDTNTFFWCRLCMMAHEADVTKYNLTNVYSWWHGNTTNRICINDERWIK